MKRETQLDLIPQVKQRGGTRPGAGRKRTSGGSVVMRIPETYAKAVKSLVAELEALHQADSKQVRETEWEHVLLDGYADNTGSARYQIRVAKY